MTLRFGIRQWGVKHGLLVPISANLNRSVLFSSPPTKGYFENLPNHGFLSNRYWMNITGTKTGDLEFWALVLFAIISEEVDPGWGGGGVAAESVPGNTRCEVGIILGWDAGLLCKEWTHTDTRFTPRRPFGVSGSRKLEGNWHGCRKDRGKGRQAVRMKCYLRRHRAVVLFK